MTDTNLSPQGIAAQIVREDWWTERRIVSPSSCNGFYIISAEDREALASALTEPRNNEGTIGQHARIIELEAMLDVLQRTLATERDYSRTMELKLAEARRSRDDATFGLSDAADHATQRAEGRSRDEGWQPTKEKDEDTQMDKPEGSSDVATAPTNQTAADVTYRWSCGASATGSNNMPITCPVHGKDCDLVCEHGTAMDVHCCGCRRRGFFPPDDCDCYGGA